MEDIEKSQMEISELKDVITEIKSLVDGLSHRMERSKERISELEDGLEMTQSKQQEEHRSKQTNKQRLRDF